MIKRKSASTLIYFTEQSRRKKLVKRPKHVNKEKRTRTLRGITVVLCVSILVGLGIWAYLKYRPLDIVSIEVVGAQRFVSAHDVKKIAEEQALGKNCLLFDAGNLEGTVTANFLAAKSVKVYCGLPKSLKVEVAERVPIALIQSRDKTAVNTDNTVDPAFYFVDADGFVLGLADTSATNLTVINYGQQVEVGRFINQSAVAYYFDLINALDEDGISVSTISSYPRYTTFFTREDLQVVVTNSQSAKSQVKIFAKMIEAFKAEGRKPKKIDLRFDKVVVEFFADVQDKAATASADGEGVEQTEEIERQEN